MIRLISSSALDREKLASLAINPAQLVDDGTDYAGVFIQKPWGGEYLAFQNAHVALWVLHITQGGRTSLHCHLNKKTSLVVLGGDVVVTTLGQTMQLTAGDGLFLAAGVFHATKAVSNGEAIVMESETPVNKRDLVRLEDHYGREDRGYEGREFHADFLNIPRKEFHDEADRYDTVRPIGDCELVIHRHDDPVVLERAAKNFGPEMVGLLSGAIQLNNDNIAVGNVINWPGAHGCVVHEEAEVLFIKRTNKSKKKKRTS